MKFLNNKMKYIIKKGLALVLSVVLVSGMIPAIPAYAAPVTSDAAAATTVADTDAYIYISNEATATYLNYMYTQGLNSNQYSKSKDRIVALSEYLNKLNPNIEKIDSKSVNSHEKNTIRWYPTQSDIDAGRDLYMLEWVNGDYAANPGSGYEILGRIVYLGADNKVYYTPEVNIDYYPRKLAGFSDWEQWNQGRINQALFAMPQDCKQLLGVLMCNESGGGNNNNTWWMDSLHVSRITSDRRDDIETSFTNNKGFKEFGYSNGQLVAYASAHDIKQRYLGGMDMRQEWLYLLQTPEYEITTGAQYYAQIVTTDGTDLSDKNLTVEIDYTDIAGNKKTFSQLITDESVDATYPKTFNAVGYVQDHQNYETVSSTLTDTRRMIAWAWYDSNFDKTVNTFRYSGWSNDIMMELVSKAYKNYRYNYVVYQMDRFENFNWETATLTEINTTAAAYFGNFAGYAAMRDQYLRGYAATDIKLNISETMVSIDAVRFWANSGSVQDIRIYAASSNQTDGTRMNGGLGLERFMPGASNSVCMASLDSSAGPLHLTGSMVTCTPESENNAVSRKLLVNTNKKMNFYDPNDTLGVVLSFADVYEAGIEAFAADYESQFKYPYAYSLMEERDRFYSTSEAKNNLFDFLIKDHKGQSFWDESNEPTSQSLKARIEKMTALEIINLMESYFKDCLTLTVRYIDNFGATREVKVPFVTTYMLQLYSDNNGRLGTNENNFITGVFQQGQDVALRVPLSQYESLLSVELGFNTNINGVENFKINKYMYADDPDIPVHDGALGNYTLDDWFKSASNDTYENHQHGFVPKDVADKYLKPYETFKDGAWVSESIAIQYIRIYEHVGKDNFKNVYNPQKRIVEFKTNESSDFYFAASNRKGHIFSSGQTLRLSLDNDTLLRGTVDLFDKYYEDSYLIEINGKMISTSDLPPEELNVTFAYTTTGGEQVKVENKKLSDLAKDINGHISMTGRAPYPTGDEYQTQVKLRNGSVQFIMDLTNVSSFDYIKLALPDGATNGWQVNSVYIYRPTKLGQRYSEPKHFTEIYDFYRDYEGEVVALNNKPAALQPGQAGRTFYFTKVNEDGTIVPPDTDVTYEDDYILVPPTSITYQETLKNLGLSITKYTYTVDVDVANVLDAGSGNYFYFQLVFENGTSGVVLANQQLAADSFRQGYTESFTIHTTQNYGNVTGVRVICDTSSSDSTAFDKLNIDKISVSLPSNGGAKSWIMDKVGWIDINYQDEGSATAVANRKENAGFPNSMVVKEFARTRTASTARLLFNISTAASSPAFSENAASAYEAALTYIDSEGYTQTYNFNLKNAIFNYIENTSWTYLFRPNMSDYFTLSLNDIASVKSLSIYRADGQNDWIIKDISISQFSDLGDVYMDTTGEFKRYVENETLITTSTSSEQTITRNGNATFLFSEHSISVNTNGTNPEGWTTTITRLPVTTQETLNLYMYAGSSNGRNYEFGDDHPPVRGRLEYTFKENGATIGSESFAFNEVAEINGVKVLKATGVKVNGMNQLKSLYLMSETTQNPVISGVQVERIRGNTIVERLYFDYNDETLTQGVTYSSTAKADTSASNTKQTLALQISNGQKQTFGENNDVAVALLYTNENDVSGTQKTVYSSPYVFFTDVGITSLSNTSVLEIPFEISGVDQIAGFSIISNGADITFENALIYNYLSSRTGDMLIDSCPIAEKITTSTVAKQYLEKANTSVTPVTLTFTTSPDSQYQGSGSSGRLPLTINYRNNAGKDIAVSYDNFLNLLPANTVPSAGSTVSVKVQLTNLDSLTSASITAMDDDWHLYKVAATINQIANATQIPQNTEAFVDGWVTSNKPVTAVFGSNTQSKIINFSVTALAVESGNVETATSGNVLKIQAFPGEKVSFMPTITAEGTPDKTVVWDTSKYSAYMVDGGGTGLDFTVPLGSGSTSSAGQVFTFTGYCSFDTSKTITITIEVVPPAEVTPEEVVVKATMTPNEGSAVEFNLTDGDSYTHYVNVGSTATEWTLTAQSNIEGYSVEFTPATLTVDTTAANVYTSTMTCLDAEGAAVFTSDIRIIVSNPDAGMKLSITGDSITGLTETFTAIDNNSGFEFEVPADSNTYTFTATPNVTGDVVDIRDTDGNSLGTTVSITGEAVENKVLKELVAVYTEPVSGSSFSINVTVKTIAAKTAITSSVNCILASSTGTELANDVLSAPDSATPARYSITTNNNYTLTFAPMDNSFADVTVELIANNVAATLSGNTVAFNATAETGTVLFTAKVTCKPAAGASGTETVHYFEAVKSAPSA